MAFNHILEVEGGYVDHPRDPGGCTNRGITLAVYREEINPKATCADLRRLTLEEAERIYRKRFWTEVRGDDLPSGVDLCVFDAAVHSGSRRAIRWLQQVVGAVDDGVLGAQTMAAVYRFPPERVVKDYCARRLRYLRWLSTWDTFGKGWTRRIARVESRALGLIHAVAQHSA